MFVAARGRAINRASHFLTPQTEEMVALYMMVGNERESTR